jgi:zinc-ribbon domain
MSTSAQHPDQQQPSGQPQPGQQPPAPQPTPLPSAPVITPGGGSLCQRCGTQNAPGAHFCMNCANPLPSPADPPTQTPPVQNQEICEEKEVPGRTPAERRGVLTSFLSFLKKWVLGKDFRTFLFYPLFVAILTFAFTLGVQSILGPQDESTIIQLMDQEAQIAMTHTGSPASIYDARATVIDAGCQTSSQGVVWSGLAQITDRYNNLGRFTSLEHADPHISWEPDSRWATKAYVSATTIGAMASGPIHGNERWTFAKINDQWLITSFTYNFCQP